MVKKILQAPILWEAHSENFFKLVVDNFLFVVPSDAEKKMWKAPSTNDLLSIYEPTEEDIYSPASRNPMSYGTDDDDENDNSVKINLLELHQSQKSKTKPKKQKKQKKAKNTFVQERELQTSPTRQEQQLDMLEQNSAQQVAGIWQTKPLLTEVHFNFSNCLQQYVNLDSNTKPSYFFQSMALASQYKDAYQKELKKTDRACHSVFKRMDEKYPDLYRDEFVKLNSYADLNLTRTGAACCVHKNKLFVYGMLVNFFTFCRWFNWFQSVGRLVVVRFGHAHVDVAP